ncbi:hypothetical protein PANT_20c00063 [Moesziomyces antarcticus T-34]|uniref:2,5-diamino-6-ribosylamino-4(3H)-pyrimidinone 5'-phosphate reductase n=1 Tax=Pseudozyma antarctica (strain T-34) TaxID=1151754 RepID=M9LS66_PSEA3|nr:hypothetical protein PANT_20c00063 [Moesziomyces antarcticus T-34]
MQGSHEVEEQATAFLDRNLRFSSGSKAERPHVTLTFAVSHDGKIAGPGKAQLALSGAESMLMTHTLRTLHDGILVGIGTVLNDNPQLNARLLSQPPTVAQLPRPVVLDSQLRTPSDCKLIRNHTAGVGRQPLILASERASQQRRLELERAGAEVVQVPSLDWQTILKHVHAAGLRRLMVEGGAAVIDSLMQQPQHIDALLVTIAPVTVGPQGFGFSSPLPDVDATDEQAGWSTPSRSKFGKDDVAVWHRHR